MYLSIYLSIIYKNHSGDGADPVAGMGLGVSVDMDGKEKDFKRRK